MTEDTAKPVEESPVWADGGERLVVDLEGFEGPIDLLLALAREQKVDLKRISILRLADQYLDFIAQARQLRLEVAADYLVMAAWLAYLKSRLLLPEAEQEEEPTAAEMAAALAFQLQRLQSMQDAGARLRARPRLGFEIFARGAPERFRALRTPVYQVTLFDLLKAYGEQHHRHDAGILHITPNELYTVEEALKRLRRLIGRTPDWQSLSHFLPPNVLGGVVGRSALASTLMASLELARAGKVQLRQNTPFGPIYLRAAPEAAVSDAPRSKGLKSL